MNTKNMKKKKGFTLAELLIVVAIIGVLVSVSIPVFNSQLEKAKQATDLANMRSAQAAAVSEYLLEGSFSGEYKYNFDAATGKVTTDVPVGYGKSRELTYNGVTYYPLDKYVVVTINENSVVVEWSDSDSPIANNGGNTVSGGGIDVPPTPDPNDGDGNASSVNANYNVFAANAGDGNSWPTSDDVNNLDGDNAETFSFIKGEIFVEDGIYYVAIRDGSVSFNMYYYRNASQMENEWQFASVTSDRNFFTDSNLLYNPSGEDSHFIVSRGDVYVDPDGKFYVAAESNNWMKLPKDGGNWVEIKFNS